MDLCLDLFGRRNKLNSMSLWPEIQHRCFLYLISNLFPFFLFVKREKQDEIAFVRSHTNNRCGNSSSDNIKRLWMEITSRIRSRGQVLFTENETQKVKALELTRNRCDAHWQRIRISPVLQTVTKSTNTIAKAKKFSIFYLIKTVVYIEKFMAQFSSS